MKRLLIYMLIIVCNIVLLKSQTIIDVVYHNLKGEEQLRTYIGEQKKFTDTITGLSVVKTLIVTEKSYRLYKVVDSIFQHYEYIDDYKDGYVPDYVLIEDSILVFKSTELADDYDVTWIVDGKVYEDLMHLDSTSGYRRMQYDIKEVKPQKEEEVIASFTTDSLTWGDIRTLPLKPFVRQELDTLGRDSIEFKTEMNFPMTYEAIYDSISSITSYGIDSLKTKGIDPYQTLAEITRCYFMIPYYKKNINVRHIREAIMLQMKQMAAKRIVELRNLTGYDLRKDRSLQNVIQTKDVTSYNPRCVNLDKYIIEYVDENGDYKEKEYVLNKSGRVTAHFHQIYLESLKVVAKNLAYEMNKWVDRYWAEYNKVEEDEDGFEEIKDD